MPPLENQFAVSMYNPGTVPSCRLSKARWEDCEGDLVPGSPRRDVIVLVPPTQLVRWSIDNIMQNHELENLPGRVEKLRSPRGRTQTAREPGPMNHDVHGLAIQ